MRIIGYVPHDQFKITVFKDNNRLSIKFESGLYEQVYQFRDTAELQNMEQVRTLVDAEWLAFVTEEFKRLHQAKNAALARFLPAPDEWMDTII